MLRFSCIGIKSPTNSNNNSIPPMVTKVLHKTEQANIDHQPERGSSCNTGPTVKIYLHVKSQPSRKKFKESKWT
ncbi:unnamed protein product [Rhizophagus irregularis]|nr:unnamed protein product [Rhizophagus irregularis]